MFINNTFWVSIEGHLLETEKIKKAVNLSFLLCERDFEDFKVNIP
jgi:hypothetical protein